MPDYYNQSGVYIDPIANLYPPVCGVIYPRVERKLDAMSQQYGPMYVPDREHYNSMVDDIYNSEEDNLQKYYEERSYDRQWHGRPFLRDLIGLVLIESLLDRRRRFDFGHHGFSHQHY